jgi:glycosyltransferase involved in cell wall biosynthesis
VGASDAHASGIVDSLRERGWSVTFVEPRATAGGLLQRLVGGLLLQVRHHRVVRAADVVYVRFHPLTFLTLLLAGRRPVVYELNGVPDDFVIAHPKLRGLAWLLRLSFRHLLRWADLVITVTDGLATRAAELAPATPVAVVPNAVDPAQFVPDAPRPLDVPDGSYVIWFGALSPWQGIDLVLDAAVSPDWPAGTRLLVIGDGPEGTKVSTAARSRPDRIVFLGSRARGDLPAYVANASASVIIKEYHDLVAGQSPLKLYESAACAVPAIVSRMHGLSDVPGLTAFVLAVESTPDAIARAVAWLQRHPDELAARGAAGRSAVLATENWDVRGAETDRLLRVLIDPIG